MIKKSEQGDSKERPRIKPPELRPRPATTPVTASPRATQGSHPQTGRQFGDRPQTEVWRRATEGNLSEPLAALAGTHDGVGRSQTAASS